MYRVCRYNRRDPFLLRLYTGGMGLRIKELRENRGWSQAILAEKAGVSRSQLSEIENERKPANTLRLSAIARALDVDVDELFTDDAREAYKSVILSLMRRMSDADRESVIRHARALAGSVNVEGP